MLWRRQGRKEMGKRQSSLRMSQPAGTSVLLGLAMSLPWLCGGISKNGCEGTSRSSCCWTPEQPPCIDPLTGNEEREVQEILGFLVHNGAPQCLIQWAGKEDSGDTWEPVEHLTH